MTDKAEKLLLTEEEPLSTVNALLRGTKPTTNAFESTVERLSAAIKMGLYRSGSQLPPEPEMAEIMGVSRNTLREAIRVLLVQGILTVKRGRTGGTFVSGSFAPPSVVDLRQRLSASNISVQEILDHRLIIEVGVAGLAAQRATDQQQQALQTLVDKMFLAEDDFREYRRLDTCFHLLLASATQSNRLISVMADTHAELSDLMSAIPHSKPVCAHSSRQHRRLADAIQKGQVALAKSVMEEHTSGTYSLLNGLLG